MINSQLCLGIIALLVTTNAGAFNFPSDTCTFSWLAKSGDTCKSIASAWEITEAQFISFNPGVVCSALVANREYCVEQNRGGPSPTTTLTATTEPTTSSTGKATTTAVGAKPSQTQPGVSENCEPIATVTL